LNRFRRTLTLPQMLLFAVHFFEIVLGGPEENMVFWTNCRNVWPPLLLSTAGGLYAVVWWRRLGAV